MSWGQKDVPSLMMVISASANLYNIKHVHLFTVKTEETLILWMSSASEK